jgi:Zn-dependent alcohol dehydrogenase
MVLGHEGGGVVAAVGDGVRQARDHVVFAFVRLRRCVPCLSGRAAPAPPVQASVASSLISGRRLFSHRDGEAVHQQLASPAWQTTPS